MEFGITNEAFKLILDDCGIEAARAELSRKALKIAAARGDWAAFQIIFLADENYSVNISNMPWLSKNGPILNARVSFVTPFKVKCYIEQNVTDDDGIEKADILLEHDVAEAAAGKPFALFCEIETPKDAVPGSYDIKVDIYLNRLFEDEIKLGSLDIEVKVFEIELPANKSFYLDLWQHTCNIARKHDVPLFSDAHFAVLEKYVQCLAALGQKSITVIAGEAPWKGQSCYLAENNKSNLFEYSMIRTEKLAEGTFRYDYSVMERYIQLCRKHGIEDEIEVFGLLNVWKDADNGYGSLVPDYPDYIKIRYLDKTDGCYKYMHKAEDIDNYIKALEGFFISKGLINSVRIAADEPADAEMYRKSLARIKRTAPSFKCKAAINHIEFIEEFSKDIYDFAPYIYFVSKEWDKWCSYLQSMKDKNFLWYVCCSPKHPNTFIGSKLLESRFIGILTSYMNFDGFLRWNYTVWPENPRSDIRYGNFPAGDTNFVYPAFNGSVALSLRYKQLKRGIEDFELLKLLKDKGRHDVVKDAFELILKEKDVRRYFLGDWDSLIPLDQIMSLDYSDYARFRELILSALSQDL